MRLNRGRIWLGGLTGGVVWTLWSYLVGHFVITDARYLAAQNAGFFLKTPLGFLAGFFAGFPGNFAQATWFAGDRGLPFGWMIEMWLGAILAALVAGWLYKD